MINELSELVSTVNRHKISHISLLDSGFLKETQSSLTQLYNAIADHNGITDEEAKALIYNEDNASDERYRKLKSRLRKRLLNTIFVVDYEEKGGYSDYQKAYLNCHKDWALIKLLQAYGCRATFINMSKELLAAAEKWQFTDIVLMTAQVLSTASGFNGHIKQQAQYRQIAEKAKAQYFDELQCQMEFDELIALLNSTKGVTQKLLPIARAKSKAVNTIAGRYPTIFRVQLLVKRISFVIAELEGNINTIIDACEAGEQLINANLDFYTATSQAEFVLNHMLCYLRLKNYTQGITYYQRIKGLVQPESGHYLTLQYYYILSLIHGGKYPDAANAFNNAAEHHLFKSQTRPMLVRWRLMEGALNFIAKEGLIGSIKLKSLQGKAFIIFKLMNDIGAFAEDKAGINMVLQSMYIAYLIQDGKYKKLSDLQANLYTYVSRYLKNNENQSALLFMRMLNILISTNFSISETSPKVKDLYKKLESIPPSLAQDVSIDVLPFTWLWRVIMLHSNKY